MPGAHVFGWNRRDVYGGVCVVSSERDVGRRQSVGSVLLLRGGVRARQRHRAVCAVQPGQVQRAACADGLLELLGRAVRGRLRIEGRRQLFAVSGRYVVAGGEPGLQHVPGQFCRAGAEWNNHELHLRRWFYRAKRRAVCRLRVWQVQARERERRVHELHGERDFVVGKHEREPLLV